VKTPTKHVTELSDEQKVQLQGRMRKATSWRERMRAHGILLSSRGFSIDEIASIYDVDRDTVSGWITKWEQNGFDSLADKPLAGRPPTLTAEEQELVLQLVAQEPRRIKRVAGEIERQTGKRVSADAIKRIVKAADQVWKRVRKAPAKRPDPQEVEESKQELEDWQERADDGDLDLYYFDAAGFSLDPAVPYAWQARGVTLEVPTARSKRLNVIAFYNTDNEVYPCMLEGSIDSHVVTWWFDEFCARLRRRTVVVIDNAPIHTRDELQECVDGWRRRGLIVYVIPESSPELNLIEILWRKIKYEWIPFSAYQSFERLRDALMEIFSGIGSKYRITFAYALTTVLDNGSSTANRLSYPKLAPLSRKR
jgi:transposase